MATRRSPNLRLGPGGDQVFGEFQYPTPPLLRSRGGIHDLLDFETARNVAEHLSEVHEAIQDGEGISGPAARRLINAGAQEHSRFGGIIASVRQARSLLADPRP